MKWKASLAAVRQLVPFRRKRTRAPSLVDPATLAELRERERREEQVYFIDAMRRMSKADPSLRSHLYIISLADFREAVSTKWSRLADKVAVLTRSIIGRHIGKGDLFTQADDETFVLAMPTLTRQEARQRIVTIAQDLSDRLLGDSTVAGRRPEALAANLPFSAAIGADGNLDLSAIQQVVAQTRSVIDLSRQDVVATAAADTAATSGVVARWHLETLMRGAERISIGMPLTPEEVANDPGTRPAPPPDPGGWTAMTSAEDKVVREWKCFQANAPAHEEQPQAEEDCPALPEGASLSMMWRPAWVAAGEAISAYQARVLRIDRPGAAPLEGSEAYPTRATASGLAIDRFVVATSVAALRAADAAGRRTTVVVPLCWSSLDPATRWSLLGPVSDLPAGLRRERVKIELFHIPPDAGEAEIANILSFIRGLGVEPVVRLRPSSAPIGMVARAGASVISMDMAELGPDEQMGDDDLLVNLQRFQQSAARRSLGCALWGARRRRVVVGLILGGFRMVNGPGLASDLARLGCVLPAPREQFADVG